VSEVYTKTIETSLPDRIPLVVVFGDEIKAKAAV
jgi:hypothetical protein